jgi:hypothetical protein
MPKYVTTIDSVVRESLVSDEPVPLTALRLRRQIVKPFAEREYSLTVA